MSKPIKVNSFNVSLNSIQTSVDMYHLFFNINDGNYFSFPCSFDNFNKYIINDIDKIISGKEKTIDLKFNYNYNMIQFNKDTIRFFMMNDNSTTIPPIEQEISIIFENNNIVRNSLRTFVTNFRKEYHQYYSSDFEEDVVL
jgi:hypothetical protein